MKLNVVIFSERDLWMAVGLERFFAGYGKTPLLALQELARNLEGTRLLDLHHNQEPFALVPPAPEEYQQMWATAPLRLTWEESEVPAALAFALEKVG